MTPETDIFIMAALHEEVEFLKSVSKLVSTIPAKKGNWQIRKLKNGKYIALSVCGILAKKAQALIEKAVEQCGMKQLVIAGCCGGLEPGMKFGTAVIADSFVDSERSSIIKTDEKLNKILKRILPEATTGSMLYSASILETAEQKLESFTTSKAKAVEMEGLTIAQIAINFDIAVSSVRWVLDGEDESIKDTTLLKSDKNTLTNRELRKRLGKISNNIAGFVEKLSEMM